MKLKRNLAFILAIMIMFVSGCSFLIFMWNESNNTYSYKSYEQVLKEQQEDLLQMYAVEIYENYQQNQRKQSADNPLEYEADFRNNALYADENEKYNFHYGFIIFDENKDSADEIDVNNRNKYDFHTFSRKNPSDFSNTTLMQFEARINYEQSAGKNMCNLLLENTDYYEHEHGEVQYYTEAVNRVVYYPGRDLFFYETKNGYYYPVQIIYFDSGTYQAEHVWSNDYRDDGSYYNDYEGVLNCSEYKQWENLQIDGYPCPASEIAAIEEYIDSTKFIYYGYHVTMYPQYPESETIAAEAEEETITTADTGVYVNNNDRNYVYKQLKIETYRKDTEKAYLLLALEDTLSADADDVFYVHQQTCKLLYHLRYPAMIAIPVSILMILLCLKICVGSTISLARETETSPFFYKIPLEIYLCGLGVLIFGICGLTVWVLQDLVTLDIWFPTALYVELVIFIGLILALALHGILYLVYCFSAKKQKIWQKSIFYPVLSRIRHVIKWSFKKCRGVFLDIRNHLSMVVRVTLAFGVFCILELIIVGVLSAIWYIDFGVIVIVCILKLIEYILLLAIVLQMKSLQEGAKRLAEGDLEHTLDTMRLHGELKCHGEYLNQIQQGIQISVSEKVKSEHFKTELITNVSHDIKTPLTSIINYVDLMQKEEIAEPKVKEYLEVLQRQSARLKKLIEDLMQASKASTGNLEVHWTECDINILLSQMAGEFEEKLQAQNLRLMISQSEEPVKIMADNSHLWRIFDNLMNNICKYSQPGTRVYINQEIITEDEKKMVVLTFRNISRYELNVSSEELMERFVRGDASRHTEGSGLGLSIAQNLAALMNGTLELFVDGDLFKVVLKWKLED